MCCDGTEADVVQIQGAQYELVRALYRSRPHGGAERNQSLRLQVPFITVGRLTPPSADAFEIQEWTMQSTAERGLGGSEQGDRNRSLTG